MAQKLPLCAKSPYSFMMISEPIEGFRPAWAPRRVRTCTAARARRRPSAAVDRSLYRRRTPLQRGCPRRRRPLPARRALPFPFSTLEYGQVRHAFWKRAVAPDRPLGMSHARAQCASLRLAGGKTGRGSLRARRNPQIQPSRENPADMPSRAGPPNSGMVQTWVAAR
jgi:hypothetical protein